MRSAVFAERLEASRTEVRLHKGYVLSAESDHSLLWLLRFRPPDKTAGSKGIRADYCRKDSYNAIVTIVNLALFSTCMEML